MDKTAVFSPATEELNQLRDQLAAIHNKIMQLGQTTLTLYAQGELAHDDLVPMCEELLALEQALLPQAVVEPDKPTDTGTDKADISPDEETLLVPIPPELHTSKTADPDPPEQIIYDPPAQDDETMVIKSPIPQNEPKPTWETKTRDTNQIVCPSCRNNIPADTKFCTICGYALSNTGPMPLPPPPPAPTPSRPIDKTTIEPSPFPNLNSNCPRCQEPLVSDSRFCTNCGEPVTAPPPPPLPVSQTAETIIMPKGSMPITKYCENCGYGATAITTKCPDCNGTKFGSL